MTAPVPMPDGFYGYARHRSLREISAHYKVSVETVMRWRRESALESGRRTAWTPDEDAYLIAHYATSRPGEIGERLNRTLTSVRSRAKKLGLQTPKSQAERRDVLRIVRPRDLQSKLMPGNYGEAAYLQAYGPLYRCYSDGKPAPAGHYWYWAGQVLTHDEMEAKARSHRERRALLDMAA